MRLLNFHPLSSVKTLVSRVGSDFTGAKGLGLMFLVGFLVRLVPELLAFTSPIGFDTVYYASVMKNGDVWYDWISVFTYPWLLNSLIVPLYSVSQIDPFLLLKVIAPTFYGLNVAGIYWFGKKMLGWDTKICLVAAGVFALQIASIRISWDLLRNMLGLGILLFALPLIKHVWSRRGFVGFAFLSLLTVFAHEYAAVILVVVVLGLLVWLLIRGKFGRGSVRILLASLPALVVFAVGIFLRFFPAEFDGAASNVLSTNENYVGRSSFFMANYLVVNDAAYYYPSYWSLISEVLLLFTFLYLPYLFLVWKGYFKNGILNLWLGLLLVGAFGCIIWPFFALDFWARWMFMLVYPFTFYAVYGLFKIFRSADVQNRLLKIVSKGVAVVGLVVLLSLGCGYLAIPVLAQTDNLGIIPTDVSLHFSSAPSVPYEDVKGVIGAMRWLDLNIDANSFVILHHSLLYWGQLYLNNSRTIVHFWHSVDEAVDLGFSRGLSHAFLVWWDPEIEWYNVSISNDFEYLTNFDRISVFEYTWDD